MLMFTLLFSKGKILVRIVFSKEIRGSVIVVGIFIIPPPPTGTTGPLFGIFTVLPPGSFFALRR